AKWRGLRAPAFHRTEAPERANLAARIILVNNTRLAKGASRGETSMQREKLIVTTICLLITGATTSSAQTGNSTAASDPRLQQSDLAAQVRRLAAEVRSLKLEMLKLQLESQQAKLAQLEREIEQTQKSKQRLEAQERGFNQEMAEYDERLGQPDLEASER